MTYYFAIRASDEAPNVAALSNSGDRLELRDDLVVRLVDPLAARPEEFARREFLIRDDDGRDVTPGSHDD